MNTAPDTIGREHLKALRLNRPLLPIEHFAAREGTTVEEIEKCSNIGIVQLRKHKGRTYVVDIPVYSYDATAETDAEVAGLISSAADAAAEPAEPKAAEHTTEREAEHKSRPEPAAHKEPCSPYTGTALFKNLRNSARNIKTKLFKAGSKQNAAAKNRRPVETVEPGSISTLVEKMVEKSNRIKQHLEQDTQQTTEAEKEPEIPQITEQLIQHMNSQLDRMENAVEKSGILLKRIDKPSRDTAPQPVRNNTGKPRENDVDLLKAQLRQIEHQLNDAHKQHSETTKRLHSQIEELSQLLSVMGRDG